MNLRSVARLFPGRLSRASVKSKGRAFWHASRPLKGLLLRLPWMIGGMRLGLRFTSFQSTLRVVERWSQQTVASRLSPEEITWAVRAIGRRMLPPDRPCLPLALVTTLLLRRRGYPATLRLGVAKDEHDQLAAHAWVESDGAVIMGRLPDLSTYVPFPQVE